MDFGLVDQFSSPIELYKIVILRYAFCSINKDQLRVKALKNELRLLNKEF